MKRIIVPVVLLILQVYLVYKGAADFGKVGNPFVLLAISLSIPIYCCNILLKGRGTENEVSRWSVKNILIGGSVGLLSIIIFYKKLYAVFTLYKDYGASSDVLPQLETLYNRFSHGIFPYAPLEQFPWHPYPVYMPLNWLPVGLAAPLQCDVRWIGILFLGIIFIIWGFFTWRTKVNIAIKAVIMLLPVFVLWAILQWDSIALGVTLETLIMAFYFLLAYGLMMRNLPVVVVGILCCLLSRYTMLFWLPLFFMLLWVNETKRKNYITWVSIIAAVSLLYIFPFYLKDPSILTDGIAYHNHCYADAWNGLGDPEGSVAFDDGLNFSWFIREATSGTMEHRVSIARGIQGALMLLLFLFSWLGYKKWRAKIHFYDYSLIMLYCFLLVFFMASPLTYKYYFMPLFMVSAVLVARVMVTHKRM